MVLTGFIGFPAFLLAALRPKDGEAHRVVPEFPVGFHVLGFLLHDDTSLIGFLAGGSADDVLAENQDGIRPHPVHALAHQVDPGVCLNPACCCIVNSGQHFFTFALFPFVKLIIDILRRNKIGARLNVV
jgi:hypothetical protein